MAQRPQLTAEPRTLTGKKVKKLRRDGKLPANMYGKGLASKTIQVDTKTFETLFKEVGETGLIDLMVDGESHPVLVKNLQLEYPERTPLHVDFYQVNLKEKVKTMVPLVLIGEAKAVTDNVGLVLQQINEVEVEALPESLPEHIEVDITNLANIDDQIIVSDLKTPEGVTILTDPGQIIVKIGELVVAEPEVVEEKPAEGEEGAAATEVEGSDSAKATSDKEKAEKESEKGEEKEGKAE